MLPLCEKDPLTHSLPCLFSRTIAGTSLEWVFFSKMSSHSLSHKYVLCVCACVHICVYKGTHSDYLNTKSYVLKFHFWCKWIKFLWSIVRAIEITLHLEIIIISLSSFPILLNISSTDCKECRSEVPRKSLVYGMSALYFKPSQIYLYQTQCPPVF